MDKTMKQLEEMDDIDFAISILNERKNKLTNMYSPLSNKINSAVRTLDSKKRTSKTESERNISITIHDEVKTFSEMSDLLRHIADLLDEGYSSGYYPTWELERDVRGARIREESEEEIEEEN